MLCVKTGCHLYDSQSKVFYHGDLYAETDQQNRTNHNEVWILKFTWKGFAAGRDVINCEVQDPLMVVDIDGRGAIIFKQPDFFSYQGKRLEDVLPE